MAHKDSTANPDRNAKASVRSEPARPGENRAEQRNQKENQVAQLSAANIEESPKMDPGDSAEGSGESLGEGAATQAGAATKRGAVDAQYGTRSAQKSSSGASPAGSGPSRGVASSDDERPQTSNPGSSEKSTGSERDTMSGPRPGGGS